MVLFLKSVYDAIASGQLPVSNGEQEAQATAKKLARELDLIKKKSDDTLGARGELGDGYLKNKGMLSFWEGGFEFMDQCLSHRPDDQNAESSGIDMFAGASRDNIKSLSVRLGALSVPLLQAASNKCLDPIAVTLIGERWSKVDDIYKMHGTSLGHPKECPSWYVNLLVKINTV